MSKITWFIKDNGMFTAKAEHNAGAFKSEETMSIDFQIWNNRWGVKDESPLEMPVINFFFDDFEDSSLLPLCKLIVNETDEVALIVRGSKATAVLDRTISGKANNGDDRLEANLDNFINVKFELSVGDKKLKPNDLKKLFFEVSSLA